MKKAFTRLLSLLALSLMSVAGFAADYTFDLGVVAKSDYASAGDSIPLTDFIQKFGLTEADTAAFAAAEKVLYLDGAGTDVSYTANYWGFWFNDANENIGWTDGTWYVESYADTETNQLYINTGIKDASEEDTSHKITLYYKYNDKVVSVDLNFAVTGYVAPELVDASTFASEPVAVFNLDVTQKVKNSYDVTAYSFPLDDLAPALGFSVEELSELDPYDLIWAKEGLTDDETILAHNNLSQNFTQGAGFWFGNVEDEDSKSFVGICSWGSSALFYVTNFEFADGKFNLEIGQYPSAMSAEDSPYTTPLYFMYGDKKVQFNINFTAEAVENLDLSETTNVYEVNLVSQQLVNNSYTAKTVKVDIDAVAEAFGAGEDFTLSDASLYSSEGSNSYTTNATGFWLDGEGQPINWTDKITSPWFIELDASKGFSIGQFPGAFEKDSITGEAPNPLEMKTTLYLVYGDKNAKFNITLQIVDSLEASGLENVGDIYVVHNAIPDTQETYYSTTSFAIDMDNLASLFGVASADDLNIEVKLLYDGTETEPGSCTGDDNTGKGFWVSADGQDVGWGSSAYAGISFNPDNGSFWFYQMPDNAVLGNVTVATLLLQDEALGKQVTAHITFTLVEEVIEYEYVKTINLTAVLENDYTTVELPLDEVLEALGTDKDTYMSDLKLLASNQGVIGSSLYDSMEDGYNFTSKGAATNDDEQKFLTVRYANPESDAVTEEQFGYFEVESAEDLDEGQTLRTTVYIALGSKVVTVNITTGESVGIESVDAVQKQSGKIYDLSGRIAGKNAKGIVIMDGKKILVK
jgi:hypothetical protein